MTAPFPRSSTLADPEARADHPIRARLATAALEVPLLPEVAATVIAESDEDFDFRKVSEQIHRDQALAGHVLRIANSAAISGRATRIVSLQQALVRLGTRRVKELVLAVVMKTRIFRSHRHAARAQSIWREAAAAGCFAREIAKELRKSPETAFLCGLLHTIGKPVVLQMVTEVERQERTELSDEVVDRLIEAHYVEAGERLVSAWSLPETVAAAIVYHREPRAAPVHRDLALVAAAAGAIASRLLLGGDAIGDVSALPIFEELNLYPDDVLRILESRDRVSAYLEAFG